MAVARDDLTTLRQRLNSQPEADALVVAELLAPRDKPLSDEDRATMERVLGDDLHACTAVHLSDEMQDKFSEVSADILHWA